jgi:hypothetical protein
MAPDREHGPRRDEAHLLALEFLTHRSPTETQLATERGCVHRQY